MTEEQEALRSAVRALLIRRSGSADVWSRLCGQIGVAGLLIPEHYGGSGATLLETHIVLDELGRTLTPSPLLGSAVLAVAALLATGDEDACARLLPGMADGSTIATLAWTGPAGHWDPAVVACRAGNGLLHGEAHYVLDGDVADVLLVAAHTSAGIGLFEVDPASPGVSRERVATMDATRRLAIVTLVGAAGRQLGGDCDLGRLRDIACIALSAEQVGAASRALELTVAYCKDRVQFGQPIGSFQAVQHRLADLHVLVETARSVSYAAAAGDVPTAVAKVYCSEALMRVAGEMIQLHGGIGITWEHDAHRYFKRAHGAAQLFGRPSEHAAQLWDSV